MSSLEHIGTNALEVWHPEMHTYEHRNRLFKWRLELDRMKLNKPKKQHLDKNETEDI